MSNPLVSLNKTKKPPLLLPGMLSTPTPYQGLSPSTVPYASSPDMSNKPLNCSLNEPQLQSQKIERRNAASPVLNLNYNILTSRSHVNKSIISNVTTPRGDFTSRGNVLFKQTDPDAELLDDITTRLAYKSFRRPSNLPKISTDRSNKDSNSPPTDMDLLHLMMTKLRYFETKSSMQEKEIRDKEKRIKVLEEKLNLYEKANEKSSNKYLMSLENKNLILEQQIYEMEKFLSDYGLKWAGTSTSQQTDDDDLNDDTSSVYSIQATNRKSQKENDFKCDYDLMVENVKELNLLVEANEPKIIKQTNGATFKTMNTDKIKLVLYENGISLFSGPFRPFTDLKTQRFCIDIQDGYFPSELQPRYPDGVLIETIDKRDIYFEDKRTNEVYRTEGYRLGGTVEDDASRHHSSQFKKNIETHLTDTKLTMDQFLKKLPNCVVRNGNILNIRSDISDRLKGATPFDDNVSKQQSKQVIVDNHSSGVNESSTDPNVKYTQIKVKCESGDTYTFKMKYTDTVRDLKKQIQTQIQNPTIDFNLTSVFPPKTFTNEDLTLEQCELVPNSTILMIPKVK